MNIRQAREGGLSNSGLFVIHMYRWSIDVVFNDDEKCVLKLCTNKAPLVILVTFGFLNVTGPVKIDHVSTKKSPIFTVFAVS